MAFRSATRRTASMGLLLALAAAGAWAVSSLATAQEPAHHELTVTVRKYAFSPARIDVVKGDYVKVTLIAQDIPHSFVIDEYRIAKRVAPGKPITFEFRADRPGTFAFYCDLSSDEGCKDTRGHLVVAARQP